MTLDEAIIHAENVVEPNCEECRQFNEKALTYMKQCKYCFTECRYEPKTRSQVEREGE